MTKYEKLATNDTDVKEETKEGDEGPSEVSCKTFKRVLTESDAESGGEAAKREVSTCRACDRIIAYSNTYRISSCDCYENNNNITFCYECCPYIDYCPGCNATIHSKHTKGARRFFFCIYLVFSQICLVEGETETIPNIYVIVAHCGGICSIILSAGLVSYVIMNIAEILQLSAVSHFVMIITLSFSVLGLIYIAVVISAVGFVGLRPCIAQCFRWIHKKKMKYSSDYRANFMNII
jgi:hypothetical protein